MARQLAMTDEGGQDALMAALLEAPPSKLEIRFPDDPGALELPGPDELTAAVVDEEDVDDTTSDWVADLGGVSRDVG